ncbi:hypothetical protein MMC26_002739 [Xylographa opegraphella]|nr:hypothetical protein [Xylographa opegraphella]
MTKLLYLLSACVGGLASFATAQSTPGEFPVHGSGSSTLGTSLAPPPPVVSMTMSSMMSSMSESKMSSMSSTMMSMPTMSKTSSSMMMMPTMINNVITVIVTIDITIIEIFMGGTAATSVMAMAPKPSGVTHMVTVGGSANVFSPNSVAAAVGDFVEFSFMATNNSLTQSSFNTPCIKLVGGIDTGAMVNVNGMVTPAPHVTIQITTLTALFFFSQQMGTCGMGMVFSVNPTANMTEAMFIQKAMMENGTMTSTMSTVKPTTMMSTMTTSHSTTTMSMSRPTTTMTTMTTSRATATMTTSHATTMAMATPSLVQGTGTIVNGMCNCACLCGVNAFPAGDGIGSFGGLSGMAPQAAIMSVAAGMPTSLPVT